MKKSAIAIIMLLFFTISIYAANWINQKVDCPVCTWSNDLQVMGNDYGSPKSFHNLTEKYQFIYFPSTDSASVYTCRRCKYTAFMWDFNRIGGDTLSIVAKNLKNVKTNLPDTNYLLIPMTQRLEAAEKIYKLYEKSNDFWCWFYRVLGYHYANEGNKVKAKEARKKALIYADSLINDLKMTDVDKLNYMVRGSMEYFTGSNKSKADFIKAKTMKYTTPEMDSMAVVKYNSYLNGIIDDFLAGKVKKK